MERQYTIREQSEETKECMLLYGDAPMEWNTLIPRQQLGDHNMISSCITFCLTFCIPSRQSESRSRSGVSELNTEWDAQVSK